MPTDPFLEVCQRRDRILDRWLAGYKDDELEEMRAVATRWLALGGPGKAIPVLLKRAQQQVLEMINDN